MNKGIPQNYVPTAQEVKEYIERWNTMESYVDQEHALDLLFTKFYENKKIEYVLLKIAALNDFYSTNIFDVHSVAEHLMTIQNLDELLKKGDPNLVDKLARVTLKGKERCFFSFDHKVL